jgi:hypothetical protein
MSTIKNKSISQGKGKSRSLQRAPSPGLLEYVEKKYQKSIPVSAITAAHKLYGRTKALGKDDRFIQRFSDGKGNVDAPRLLEYLNKSEPQEKGKPLTAEAIGRVYQNFANHDGKLSFEYIMKMGENSGVQMSAKVAKAIVRKYGRRKDHLDVEDCLRISERWHNRSVSKSPSKGKR